MRTKIWVPDNGVLVSRSRILGPLFLAKVASLGDLRYATRICAALRGSSLRYEGLNVQLFISL